MKEKGHKKLWITLAAVLFGLLVIYLAGVWYFHYHLLPGLRINGESVSFKTFRGAEEKLNRPDETIEILFPEEHRETIPASAIDLEFDYADGVQKVMDAQNPFLWFLPQGGSKTVIPDTVFSEEKLTDALLALPEMQEETTRAPEDAYMKLDKDRVVIVPEVPGTRLKTDEAIASAIGMLAEGERKIDLTDPDYLAQPELTSESEKIVTQTEKVNFFLSTTVTYWFYDGTKEDVDASTLVNWLSQADGGKILFVDNTELKKRINEYITVMAFRKNVTYDEVQFRSTRRGRMFVPAEKVKFGYEIDVEGETEELFKNLTQGLSTTRKPVYSFAREFSDFIRGGYVEVDMVAQKVYCYLNGGLYYSCDCVTGLYTEKGRHTPVGVYAIQDMARNVVLKGRPDEKGVPEYQSPVSFWMPFDGGYGLHDATWQSAFGGERYKTHGSRGCVNLDYRSAETLYSVLEIGTPVIVIGEEAYN